MNHWDRLRKRSATSCRLRAACRNLVAELRRSLRQATARIPVPAEPDLREVPEGEAPYDVYHLSVIHEPNDVAFIPGALQRP